MESLSAREVARLRLHMLGIGARSTGAPTALDLVEHHLAMQSQDWNASQWAIGSRMAPGTVAGDVRAAYDDGLIVRSWPMRGTVHAVAARDIGWLLDLTGVRALAGVPRRRERHGIDEAFLTRCERVTRSVLGGGGRATRAQLRAALQADGLEIDGGLLYHVVWYLAQIGVLVMGPTNESAEQQLVLLDEWVSSPRSFADRDDALAELARGYVRARGPVSVEDFVHWSKLTKGDCRRALQACSADLTWCTCDGVELCADTQRLETISESDDRPEQDAFALAAFDEHLLGYRVRDHVLDPAHANRVDPARNGVFRWTIVDRGNVIAAWRRTRRARALRIDVDPFSLPLSAAAERRTRAALARYGEFVGQPLDIHVT